MRVPRTAGRSRRRALTAVVAGLVGMTGGVVTVLARSGPAAVAGHGMSAFGAVHDRRPACPVSATLVPSCGRWWGIAPLAHTSVPLRRALRVDEGIAGRAMDVVHVYHTDDDLFPTSAERAVALDPTSPRLLLENWKPDTHLTWAAVAAGRADARIDRLAQHIASTFRHPFFLTIWHEPEDDVVSRSGSGMTAADYVAMYRHVVQRLRADGITWAVTVMNYMGYDGWADEPWFGRLFPGRDVVDWVAIDPYGSAQRYSRAAQDFSQLVDRPAGPFPGYYTWLTRTYPGLPIMLAEWGVQASRVDPGGQSRFFRTVGQQLAQFPAIKALVYFDMPSPPRGQPNTSLRSSSGTVTAYRALGQLPGILAPRVRY